MPPYIYIGRDIDTSDTEKQFIHEFIGPGFYGIEHAPFMIPDPAAGLATLARRRRHRQCPARSPHRVSQERAPACRPTVCGARDKVAGYLNMIDQARAMMDSPVKRAFDLCQATNRPTRSPPTSRRSPASELLDKNYFFGRRFGQGLLLARRLVEAGARFVQVEYQYGAFKGFDTHEDGQRAAGRNEKADRRARSPS